ncbi:hypothetical protein B0T19DRAFT_28372 [Cercophora scortea]|uniref:Secreted protein n=1 Tax=Cercophora scortea TaxID=314031 RepID=A0AAE0MKN0_9PEZI|nr:hypothetical protein B0T19DRAFT_28372 [Cercophora scortea]
MIYLLTFSISIIRRLLFWFLRLAHGAKWDPRQDNLPLFLLSFSFSHCTLFDSTSAHTARAREMAFLGLLRQGTGALEEQDGAIGLLLASRPSAGHPKSSSIAVQQETATRGRSKAGSPRSEGFRDHG